MLRDQTALDRFLFEAAHRIGSYHPNICTIYAVENAEINLSWPLSGHAPKLVSDIDSTLRSHPGHEVPSCATTSCPGKYQLYCSIARQPEETALTLVPWGHALTSQLGLLMARPSCVPAPAGQRLGGLVAVDVSSGGQKVFSA